MKRYFLAIGLLFTSACGFQTVHTGSRGFEVRFGEVSDKVLSEGLYFYNPFTTSIEQLSVQTEVVEFETQTYTRDMQDAHIKYTITYSLQPDAAAVTYKQNGEDWKDKLVAPVLAGSVKQVVGQYDAMELIAHRDKATDAVKAGVAELLTKSHVNLIALQLSNIAYSAEFDKAVERKVIATQDAERAQNQTHQIEEESRQKVIAAKAEAESMLIRSEALSKNQNLVSYEAVQKWDGKLPVTIMGGAVVPFVKLP